MWILETLQQYTKQVSSYVLNVVYGILILQIASISRRCPLRQRNIFHQSIDSLSIPSDLPIANVPLALLGHPRISLYLPGSTFRPTCLALQSYIRKLGTPPSWFQPNMHVLQNYCLQWWSYSCSARHMDPTLTFATTPHAATSQIEASTIVHSVQSWNIVSVTRENPGQTFVLLTLASSACITSMVRLKYVIAYNDDGVDQTCKQSSNLVFQLYG